MEPAERGEPPASPPPRPPRLGVTAGFLAWLLEISVVSATGKAVPSNEKILLKLQEEIKPCKASGLSSPVRGGCWGGSMGKGEARMAPVPSVGLSRGQGLTCHQLTTAEPPRSSTAGALSPFRLLGQRGRGSHGTMPRRAGSLGRL